MILSVITLAVDRVRDLPVSPYAVGVAVFVFFCIAMFVLLAFGKGRPHG